MKKLLLVFFALISAYSGFSQCSANFTTTASPFNNALLRVALTNTSTTGTIPTGGYVSYYMQWGDGGSNPIGSSGTYYHTYSSPGTYTGMLIITVIDSISSTVYCSDSTNISITAAYTPCGASFTIVKSPTNPLQVTVTANNPAGTSGITYSWNWGDGSAAGSGSPASHTYATGGLKTITLTDSASGCSYSNTGTITVSSSCSGTANFSSSTTGSTVTFTNTSSIISGLSRSAAWYFGDGSFSSSLNPTHNYTSTGTYSVMLVNTWTDTTSSVYCIDSILKSVSITSLTNEISGDIILDSLSLMSYPEFKIWLIDFDSTTGILSAVDSTTATGNVVGWMTPYTFSGHSAGIYRVKAQLTNGPTSGTGAVPTYHNSSLLWSTATLIYHSGGVTNGININMQYGTISSGPGFIGGNVSAGANKGTAAGIPNMTIFLLDAANKPVAYTITDANGDYSFKNLAPAAYSVYPEDAGFNTTPVGITVLNSTPTFNGINFSRSLSKKTITPNTTGIVNVNTPADFVIYPNPAKNKVMISSNKTSGATITITDVTGKKVQEATMTSGKTELNLGDLQKGLYFITLEANNEKHTQKLLLQ